MEIPVTTLQAMLTNAATLGAMSAVKKLDPVKHRIVDTFEEGVSIVNTSCRKNWQVLKL